MRAARDGGQMNKTAWQDCVSPPYFETFNSKVNKKVSYLNKKSLRVFEFRDSYVLYMFYRYQHYLSISQHGEVPVILELWGMWSAPSLPSLQDPLWPGVLAPDRVLSMGK